MKTVVINLIFLFLFYGCSEKVNEKNKQKTIEKNITELESYIYQPESSVYHNSLDVEKISEETADLIAKVINTEKIDITQIQGLNKDVESNEIVVYSFGYDCGGTRGYITYPIIQWKYNNQPKAGNLSTNINFKVKNIIELNFSEKLYLLIGDEKGDGACRQSIAYVIKINGNNIDLEYQAFVKRPYLNFCNGVFSYDESKRVLNFKMNNEFIHENLDRVFYYGDKYREFKNDTISAIKLYDMIAEEYYRSKEFNLKFDGEKFVQN